MGEPMQQLSDSQVITRILDGAEDDYAVLVKRYKNSLCRVIYGYTRNWDDAEDLTQDVFIKVYKNLERYKAKGNFSSWLFRIAVNTSINFIKKARLRSVPLREELLVIDTEQHNDAPEVSMQNMTKEIYGGLDTLNQNEKKAFVLYHFGKKTYEDITAVLNKPMNTIKSYIHRARKKIRRHLIQKGIFQ